MTKLSNDKVAITLSVVSIVLFFGVLATIFMVNGDPTDWGASVVAMLAAFVMFLLIVPAVINSHRSSSRGVRFGVPFLAAIEIAVSTVVLYGIKYDWWVS